MTELVFNNRAVSRLKESISAAATAAKIFDGDYSKFLASHSAGDFFYAILRGPSNREVVKVNITGSSVANGLSIDRGQDGTVARAWPRGTLLTAQEFTAAMLSDFVSKGFRTTAVTPVGTVTPAFIGEKVFRSDRDCWYKAKGATSADWALIAGEESILSSGWNDVTSDTYWEDGGTGGYVWDGSKWVCEQGGDHKNGLIATGSPAWTETFGTGITHVRLTVSVELTGFRCEVNDGAATGYVSSTTPYPSLTEVEIVYGGYNYLEGVQGWLWPGLNFNITKIELYYSPS